MVEISDLETGRRLISNGDLSDALNLLVEKGDRQESYYDHIISLKGRYHNLEKKFNSAVISSDSYDTELNKIRADVIAIMRDIEDSERHEKELKIQKISLAEETDNQKLIQEYISNGEIGDALAELKKWIDSINSEEYDSSDYANEAVILISTYNRLNEAKANGTISTSELELGFDRIRNAALALSKKISESPKKKIEQKEKQEQIERSAASFVEESILALTKREKTLKTQAILWYIIGFLSLITGVWVALTYINFNTIDTDSVIKIIYQIFKSLFVIGLLVAASRYAFNLGKTYMNEALKNADRIHAISFGKFYLQVFGTNIKSEDLKDVFKDWNTSKESPFVNLDSNDFDHKILEAMLKFLEVMKGKGKE